MNRHTLSVLLVAVALLIRLTSVYGDFDVFDLDEHFELKAGGASCARDFELDDNDLNVQAEDIELDDRFCIGGTLALSNYPAPNPSLYPPIRYFSGIPNIGKFLAGPASNNIICGSKRVTSRQVVILIEPEEDVETSWTKIYGDNSDLATKADFQTFTLKRNTKYLFQGDQCFFEERNSGSVCFPGDATVQLRDGCTKRMDEVRIGDSVLVGHGEYSDVFAFTHHAASKTVRKYVELETSEGHRVVSTRGHYVYANGKAMEASGVRPGMKLGTADGRNVIVVQVRAVKGQGLYNPQTVHGDIVVNGIVATTYTKAVEPVMAHALLAPVRAAWVMVNSLLEGYSAA